MAPEWYIPRKGHDHEATTQILHWENLEGRDRLAREPPREKKIHGLLGMWASAQSHLLQNCWFSDRSATVAQRVAEWTVTAVRVMDIILGESARHVTVKHAVKEKQKTIWLFADSQAVANGITVWSQNWKKMNCEINAENILALLARATLMK